jgi:hypothetical protein
MSDATDDLARQMTRKIVSEKRISPQVVRIKMDISILELRRERLDEEIDEEIKELKIKLRQVEKREKST